MTIGKLRIPSGGVLDFEGASSGDLLVFDSAAANVGGTAGSFAPMSAGADDYVLTANSSATAGVTWKAATSNPSGFTRTVVDSAGPYAVPNADALIAVTYTATGSITLNLPDTGSTKRVLTIVDEGGNAAANPITIVPDGSDTIGPYANAQIEADNDFLSLYFDGTSTWRWGTPP